VPEIQKELEELTEGEEEIKGFPRAQQEIWDVKRQIRVSFKRDLAPPRTN